MNAYELDRKVTDAWLKMLEAERLFQAARSEYDLLKTQLDKKLEEDQIRFDLKEE